MTEAWKNKLYFGDNLEILRGHVDDESVDLVYLDPPFNSNASTQCPDEARHPALVAANDVA